MAVVPVKVDWKLDRKIQHRMHMMRRATVARDEPQESVTKIHVFE
jgi:hypothetical protein